MTSPRLDASTVDPVPDVDPDRRHLRRLVTLRWIALATMAGAIATVQFALEIDLPIAPLTVVVLAAAALNGFTRWRISRPWPVRPREVLAQLLADTGFLTAVLYFTGGWSNPFVSLFLLPLVIAATVMPARHAWMMAAVTFVCYTLLGFFNVPLPHMHHGDDGGFGLHVLGMWVSFVLSAGVIAWFVVRMAASLRERDRELAAARERALRDQHVLALGTLAAGAAHQLGTPLATMAVMLRELEHEFRNDPDLGSDLRDVRQQVDQCKSIISDLVAAAGQTRGEDGRAEAIDTFLSTTVETWRLQRPGIALSLHLDGSTPPPRILAERTLGHTLVTLLNNAADASGEGLEMQGHWTADRLTVEIRDRGDGLAPATLSRVGRMPITTKPEGHGVGSSHRECRAGTLRRAGDADEPDGPRNLYADRAPAHRAGGLMTGASNWLLLVDDDDTFRAVLARALVRRGFEVRTAAGVPDALLLLAEGAPSHAVVDLRMPGPSGLELVDALRRQAPDARIVVLTGYASIATAVSAMKLGATHYLAKPADADQIVAAFGDAAPLLSVEPESRPLSVDRLEWEHIQRVLAEHDGNISATARALGMHRRTLQRKLGKHAPRA